MAAERMHIGWKFWLQWVLASSMGVLVAFTVYVIASNAFGPIGDLLNLTLAQYWQKLGPLADLLYAICAGLGVGALQWLVLRRHVSVAVWWVLASAAAGFAMMPAMVIGDPSLSFDTLLRRSGVVALGGAVTGTLQWLVLRGQVSRAGWWVFASTVGWALCEAARCACTWGESIGFLILGTLGPGAVLGAVTGGALVWLLRQPVPEA